MFLYLVSLFHGISTIVGYSILKLSPWKNTTGNIHPIAGMEEKRFHKGISPKVNVISRLEFEPAYFDVPIQHVSHYATRTLLTAVYDDNNVYHYKRRDFPMLESIWMIKKTPSAKENSTKNNFKVD